jgi:hypothetical protein
VALSGTSKNVAKPIRLSGFCIKLPTEKRVGLVDLRGEEKPARCRAMASGLLLPELGSVIETEPGNLQLWFYGTDE